MILPHVLRVWQQSNRACQFLQYSFSSPFALVGQAFLPIYLTPKGRQEFVSYGANFPTTNVTKSEPGVRAKSGGKPAFLTARS